LGDGHLEDFSIEQLHPAVVKPARLGQAVILVLGPAYRSRFGQRHRRSSGAWRFPFTILTSLARGDVAARIRSAAAGCSAPSTSRVERPGSGAFAEGETGADI